MSQLQTGTVIRIISVLCSCHALVYGIRTFILTNEKTLLVYIIIFIITLVACFLFRFIRHAIDMLSKSDEDALLKMYDPTLTQENKERLTNTSSPWHPQLHKFTCDATNKAKSSVRIPPLVIVNECGYLEDRRPSSTIDPYAASEGIVKACIFGDFLNPGCESLKDVSIWDSNP